MHTVHTPVLERLIPTCCRAMLLVDHDGDSHEEAAEAGTSDLASAPDYQTVLDQVQIPQQPIQRMTDQNCRKACCCDR